DPSEDLLERALDADRDVFVDLVEHRREDEPVPVVCGSRTGQLREREQEPTVPAPGSAEQARRRGMDEPEDVKRALGRSVRVRASVLSMVGKRRPLPVPVLGQLVEIAGPEVGPRHHLARHDRPRVPTSVRGRSRQLGGGRISSALGSGIDPTVTSTWWSPRRATRYVPLGIDFQTPGSPSNGSEPTMTRWDVAR